MDAEREKRIRREIGAIAQRPNAVRFGELLRIAADLRRAGIEVNTKKWAHGVYFTIGGSQPFNVTTHNRGSSHLKGVYVKSFLRAMSELGLYGDTDD